VHHTLAEALRAYIDATGIVEDRKGWLFRTARGYKADTLSDRVMNQSETWCMIRRRAAAVGIAAEIGCHTFRATGITAYLAIFWARSSTPRRWRRTRALARPSSTIARRSGSLKTSGENQAVSVGSRSVPKWVPCLGTSL
jgi:integrase